MCASVVDANVVLSEDRFSDPPESNSVRTIHGSNHLNVDMSSILVGLVRRSPSVLIIENPTFGEAHVIDPDLLVSFRKKALGQSENFRIQLWFAPMVIWVIVRRQSDQHLVHTGE
jgi:hypothetical protein